MPARLHQIPPGNWLQLSLWVSAKSAPAAVGARVGARVAGHRSPQCRLVSNLH